MKGVTPSSGCVWFDLKRPCRKAKCAICTMSEPSIFDLLEPLSAALLECGGPDIRCGFARGTGGVDMPFIIAALAKARGEQSL